MENRENGNGKGFSPSSLVEGKLVDVVKDAIKEWNTAQEKMLKYERKTILKCSLPDAA